MKRTLAFFLLLLLTHHSYSQLADSTHQAYIDFRPGIGIIGLPKGGCSFILDLQVISTEKYWIIKPFGGVLENVFGNIMIYAGVTVPMKITQFLELDIGFAPGMYLMDKDFNLGYPLEFRSTIGLSYNFRQNSAVGIEFSHISNASLGHRNPGVETLSIYSRFPIFFRKQQR